MVEVTLFLFKIFIKLLLIFSPISLGTCIIMVITVISYIMCKKYLAKKKQYFENTLFFTYKMLDFYFIKSIAAELLVLCGIICGTFGLLLSSRLMTLNLQYNLWTLFENKANMISYIYFFNIILLFISFFLYSKSLLPILRDTYYKFHVYCLKYTLYYNFVDNLWFRFCNHGLFGIITKIEVFLFSVLKEELTEFSFSLYKDTLYLKLLLFVKDLAKNYYFIRNILEQLAKSALLLSPIEKMIIHYWPLIFIFILLVRDLKHQEIKYIYVGLFFLTIINIYRKYRQFLGQTDFREIDIKLTTYFYKDIVHLTVTQAESSLKTHKDFWKILFKCKTGIVSDIYDMPFIKKVKEYFSRNFIVDYIDVKFKPSYEPHNIRLLFFGIFILYYNFCYNFPLKYNILISIPLFCAITFYEYGAKHTNWIFNYFFKFVSINFIIISIILFIYIYLTRHNFHFIKENLWDWKINLIQHFSLEEKIAFMKEYLKYKTRFMSKDIQKDLQNILENISFNNIIEDVSLSTLKEYIENLITIYNKVTNIYLIVEYKIYYKNVQNIEKGKKNIIYRIIKHIFCKKKFKK